VHSAEVIGAGRLAVLTFRSMKPLEALGAAWHALTGKLNRASNVNVSGATHIRMRTKRKRMRMVLDGELVSMRPPLDFIYRADALRVLVPAAQSAVDGAEDTHAAAS
jgi:diacylglycerol kinase family enzyme